MMGAALPAALFIILCLIFVVPLLPADWLLLSRLEVLDTEWRIVAISLLVLVLSGALYNLNVTLTRFFEGYPWKDSWLGRQRVRTYQARFDAAKARWLGLRSLLRVLGASDPRYEKIKAKWNEFGRSLNNEFPEQRDLVLPTQLGNVIRSFEDYPHRQYGIRAITLWPRLVAKVDKDYAAAIDDAKTSLDFMLNGSFLSGVTAVALLVLGLLYPSNLSSLSSLIIWVIEIGLFGVTAWLLYLASIGRASAWGATVRAAFDLYRWDLLKQLGYRRVPATMAEERELWENISVRMIVGETPRLRLPEYSVRATFARGEPYVVELETSRGITVSGTGGPVTFMVAVKNVDPQGRTAKRVVVTDTLPGGFYYEWGSASVNGNAVQTNGANPHRFELGDIRADQQVLLTYRAILPKD
jgi:uncharacterized repeat protein (TIGR01451 family)